MRRRFAEFCVSFAVVLASLSRSAGLVIALAAASRAFKPILERKDDAHGLGSTPGRRTPPIVACWVNLCVWSGAEVEMGGPVRWQF